MKCKPTIAVYLITVLEKYSILIQKVTILQGNIFSNVLQCNELQQSINSFIQYSTLIQILGNYENFDKNCKTALPSFISSQNVPVYTVDRLL